MEGGVRFRKKEKAIDNQSELINSPDWSELTRECMINILSRLRLEDRWRGPMFVCKLLLEICKDPSLNTRFDLDPYFVSSAKSDNWCSPEFERKIDSMLRSATEWSEGSLEEIRVRYCSDRGLIFAVKRSPKLEVLSIMSSQSATDSSMITLSLSCPMLMELDISYCSEISHKSLLLLGRSLPNLKILKRNFMNWTGRTNQYLDAYPQDGDLEAHSIGTSMPHLMHLEIRFSKITSRGLDLICEGCKDMETFDLFGCRNLYNVNISSATFNLKKLKNLGRPHLLRRSYGVLDLRTLYQH